MDFCLNLYWPHTVSYTHLDVYKRQVVRLLGVYSNPHRMVRYADGNQYHVISMNFEVRLISGELGLSNETTEVGYFSQAEIDTMDLIDPHRERMAAIWSNDPIPTIA